ncbi:MAG: hypothetical protein FD131_273 [Rhodocyclaceae bacterium]|nr:MAG: hypothetical protein FD131_273 [Rhodocyclaceae bacterium]
MGRGRPLQFAQVALGTLFRLTGVEQALLLTLDIGQRLALDNFQFIEGLRAFDQLGVLLRTLGGVTGRQPVVEGVACCCRVGAGAVVLELGLIVGILGTSQKTENKAR